MSIRILVDDANKSLLSVEVDQACLAIPSHSLQY